MIRIHEKEWGTLHTIVIQFVNWEWTLNRLERDECHPFICCTSFIPQFIKKVSRWNNSTDVKLLIGPGTLMCTIYNHLKFVSSSCTYHYNVNSRKCFSPIVKTCYQSGNVYLLKSTPLHLWFCFFSSVLSRASWTNYFSQERFANICK